MSVVHPDDLTSDTPRGTLVGFSPTERRPGRFVGITPHETVWVAYDGADFEHMCETFDTRYAASIEEQRTARPPLPVLFARMTQLAMEAEPRTA